jgi:radical SAM superfamily enzyme YgiQ (UPF0313 family)
MSAASPRATPPLPQAPWVALVGPEIEENLGLRYLASALGEAGFSTAIVPFNGPDDLPQVAAAVLEAPDPPLVVALSFAFQWRAPDFLALALALRERGFTGHVTAGGHFGTFAASELLRDFPELDSICRHEAEETLVELARAVQTGAPLWDIAGLATRSLDGHITRGGLRRPPDLGTLAWPDRRGDPATCLGHPIASLVASRGCYARCAFCCIAAWHEQTLPGKRFRLREVDDVAAEMAWLNGERGVDLFIFHDDNFFPPGHARSLERIAALGAALRARGVGHIGTVVKARPTDVTPEVFRALQEELGCIRVFVGIETDCDQGLTTLRRRVSRRRNHEAMGILAALDLYVCFNLLIFDPDTTVASLRNNLEFMEAYADRPFNFGRVELYAGTPLLARMQAEGRCRGDYLGWDYRLATPEVQRVFELSVRCFHQRNFAPGALANRLMGTRFDVEVCRHFHPEVFRPTWREEARALSRDLARSSVAGLREILAFVGAEGPDAPADRFCADLSGRLRCTEAEILDRARDLEQLLQAAVGQTCRHSRELAKSAHGGGYCT